ncbi:MAG: hypothetical protein WCD04_07760 [Terriglobia bacterium]|jgi:hypothetical protein
MTDLANVVRKVRPGIWIRPLEALTYTDPALLISNLWLGGNQVSPHDLAYDPIVPEAQEKILNKGTGDDNSGCVWDRTRRMGINTLAFRLPQHDAFFVQDADCMGISAATPWEANRHWLDLLAHSGTALFVPPGEGSRVPEHAQAIREAFQLSAAGGDGGRSAGCLDESTPQTWTTDRNQTPSSKTLHCDWYKGVGTFPFPV